MTDGDSVAQFVTVVLLLVLAVPALTTAHTYAGTPLDYQDTATVDYSNDYEVSENATVEDYSENVTIVVDGSTLEADTDYSWNSTSGIVDWRNTSATSEGDSATIDYQAHQRTQETATTWMLLAPLMGLFGLFAFISAVRALWEIIGEVFDG